MLGKFLSNITNPNRPGAEHLHCYSFEDIQNGPEAMHEAWLNHLRWINSNVIGPPKATDYYSVEELEAMGMVGIYAPPFELKLEK